jgi:transcriptional regulator with XRE-family HTH domain
MNESGLPGRGGDFLALAEALRAFKAGPLSGRPSDRALAEAAGVSPSTIGDWLRGKRFPQDIGRVLIVVRMVRDAAAARGLASPDSESAGLLDDDRWRAAYREEAQRRAGVVSDEVKRAQAISALAGPAANVRVGEADPRRLGVHAAISVPGMPDEVAPEYVPRDVDAAEFGVRARVATAANRGGFVLLVGGSSVGKTRSAVEAVRALLPDWWLVHPAGPAEVAELAQAPRPRMVVWLDELQRYLDGDPGLTGAVIRALLNAPHPAVVIGTLWPDQYAAYTTLPAPGGADRYAGTRSAGPGRGGPHRPGIHAGGAGPGPRRRRP